MDLDHFDRQLLNLVQHDASVTAAQLAQQVALSPSAIQRRLRRLREEGVIARDIAVLNPDAAGYRPTTFIAAVQVETERPAQLDALRRWIAAQACIQQAFYVTGDADFILVITAPDAQAYDAFTRQMVAEHANIKRFTTSVALDVLKRGLALPLPLPAAPLA